jgi:hypothetical protein
MVKEQSVFNLFNFYRSSHGLETLISMKSKVIGLLILIIAISAVNSFRAHLNYEDVITPFFQILFGMPILFLVLYGLYYIFQVSFQDNSKIIFWNSYLQIGLPIFFGLLVMHFFNLLQFISNSVVVNDLFGIINSLLIVYLVVMFVLNTKNYFKTTYPKVLASLLLMFLVNLSLVGILTLSGFR